MFVGQFHWGGLVPVLINIPSQLSVFGVPVIQALVTVISLLVERIEEAIASENAATLNVMTMASEASDATKRAR